ncbi:MAG: transketolase, partial [Salinisphaeraceae bacterium]|nr:transketolase [Salinisphaeraceae bacterium]
SNGHGSMLLYALLHLSGYELPLEELKNFRQLGSKTPGHPEYGITAGVETTTGPLGQGLSNAVGMALAEQVLAQQFNRNEAAIVDHYTYAFTGDGCLMEGISHEASSLAGTLGLGKLVVFYDDNGISIDGEVAPWFSDDTPGRFEAYGWQVIRNVDGHDAEEIKTAIETARAETRKPTLICCKTIIGWGSPNKEGTEGVHGAPLGHEEIAATRERIGWSHGPFEIPPEVYAEWDARGSGAEAEADWQDKFEAYAQHYPELAAEFKRRMAGELPADWGQAMTRYIEQAQAEAATVATRKASRLALNAIAPVLPELLGGSADLSESNCTDFDGHKLIVPGDLGGNYISYGVREFGMSGMLNGMVLHGGLVPYGGTFLTFSDYARNAVRVAALMEVGSIFVYTHDSIALGEDGPTHQPVEHVASLRLMPNLHMWRPCDVVETAVAWRAAVERRDGPTALALTRQNLACQPRSADQLEQVSRGGYVLLEPDAEAQAVIMATGSEVAIAVEAAQQLNANGGAVRVVSMPCVEVFQAQDAGYREQVLPSRIKARIAVEAGVTDGWYRWVGDAGRVIGLDRYGESAPGGQVYKHFGFTADNIAAQVQELLK